MSTTHTSWQVFSQLLLVGLCMGMLGSLYLAYDLFGRSKMLYRLGWGFSASFLFAFILSMSWLVLIGPDRLDTGPLSTEVWRLTVLFSWLVLIMASIDNSPPSVRSPPPFVDWLKLLYWVAFIGFALVMLGAILAPQGFNLIVGMIFAIPGTIAIGAFNGFSPAIQWWILHLPEKRVAAIGALLLFCAFALLLVQPLFGLMSISF